MKHAACAALSILIATSGALGQTATPAFEVASVKVAGDDGSAGCGPNCSRISAPPGHFTAQNTTLRDIVTMAFDIKDYQISGAPGWMSSERYYIDARAEDPAPLPRVKLMLQSLLAERFHLTVHHESKELPFYILSVGKNGTKLTAGTDGPPGFQIANGAVTLHKLTISVFADRLPSFFRELEHRPTLNQTGIDGVFDFTMKLADTDVEAKQALISGDDRPSVFEIMQEQLGLKLELQKIPTDVVVIDHIEKTPTAN